MIRLIAAALVLIGHAHILIPKAQFPMKDPLLSLTHFVSAHILGVQVFFLISGFLITASYDRRRDVLGFLKARCLRLLPALWFCVLLMAFFWGPLVSKLPLSAYLIQRKTLEYFFLNGSLLRFTDNLPGIFFNEGPHGGQINGSLWTISLEVRLYLSVAFLGVTRILERQVLVTGLLMTLILILVYSSLKLIGQGEDGSSYFLSAFFFIGALLYLNRAWVPLSWSGGLGLFLLCFLFRHTGGFQFLAATVVIYGTFLLAFEPVMGLVSRKMHDYSYGMYLYGFPIQQSLTRIVPDMTSLDLIVYSLPLSLVLGAFSWHFIEKPFLSLKTSPF